jgi:hypothetical protein
MGGGTSIEGFGCPGWYEVPGDGLAAGAPGAESPGEEDDGPTHAAIDHARARTTMIHATVRMSA